MVKLYKKLYENGVGMFVDPDIDHRCLIVKFRKGSYCCNFMISLVELESRKFSLEDELIYRLKDFIYYVRTAQEPFNDMSRERRSEPHERIV